MSRPARPVVRTCFAMLTTARLKTAPPGNSPAITFPPVTAQKWTLPNGLTIIVQADRSAPVASVQAWCGTGSINEGRHLGAGLSHILEHMLFKGTKTRSTNAIAQSVQDQGGYINAYTSFDRTVYWIDVPREGVASALDILADAMMNSTLPPEEYSKEQEVIRREFAMRYDDPDRMMGQLHVQNRLSAASLSPAGDRRDSNLRPTHAAGRDGVLPGALRA